MKITTDHPKSSQGLPVLLNGHGQLMTYPDGLREIRADLKLTAAGLGAAIGLSCRTVNGWEQGRKPTAAGLNLVAQLLKRKRARR